MAEERRRGFFSRLFGNDEPEPAAAEQHTLDRAEPAPAPDAGDAPPAVPEAPARAIEAAPAAETAVTIEASEPVVRITHMADGTAVPEVAPANDDDLLRDALAASLPELLDQLRTEAAVIPPPTAAAPSPAPARATWFDRLRSGLSRSSQQLTTGITGVFTKRRLDRETLEDFEDLLLKADLGVPTAARIADALGGERLDRDIGPEEVRAVLAGEVEKVLAPVAKPLSVEPGAAPFVILMVGVNGTGKTTTIGKLAARFRGEGHQVMLAAGDTFRAAAIEQLKIWGERARVPVIARPPGSDAAGLAFDAMVEAKKTGAGILLIDTAGRLQNTAELMAELGKVIRVIRKHDPTAPHAVLLTLDATTGQNALNQVEVFRDQAGVTGLVMTKLDGTARGGILVAIAEKTGLPVHFIGVGEAIEDLSPFSARDFARAIAGLD